MISLDESDKALTSILLQESEYEINVLGSSPKKIVLVPSTSLNVRIVEEYFYTSDREEDGTEDNAWNYISRWVGKHNEVYCVSDEKQLIDVFKIVSPLEGYRGFSILYAKKEDAIHHCDVFYEYQNENYTSAIQLINDS
jgi:hypothetical protein